jgi:hypothetical protein
LAPVVRSQATVADPSGAAAIRGWSAICPSGEIAAGVPNAPPPGRAAACTAMPPPVAVSQATVVVASSATPTCGCAPLTPGPVTSTAAPNAPPGGRSATWTTPSTPSDRDHATLVVPSAPAATSGFDASPPGALRFSAAPNAPPAGRVADWTIVCAPFDRAQTAVIVLSGPAATCGTDAPCPSADRSTRGPKAPPGDLVELRAMVFRPSVLSQATTVVPSGATARRISSGSPEPGTATGAENAPPGGRVATSIRESGGSKDRQATTVVPSAATPTRAASQSTPGADRSSGAANAPPGGRVATRTIELTPSEPCQTALAAPSGATAMWGAKASPAAESVTGGKTHGPGTARAPGAAAPTPLIASAAASAARWLDRVRA